MPMSLHEVLDLRSFSTLWFWLAQAVAWLCASYWILGVPWDIVQRARHEVAAMRDLEALLAIHIRRQHDMLARGREAGLFVLSLLLTLLVTLSLAYRIEFAQAVLFLLVPLMLVAWLSLRLGLAIERQGLAGAALLRTLVWHRLLIQAIGILAMVASCGYGMWRNMVILG